MTADRAPPRFTASSAASLCELWAVGAQQQAAGQQALSTRVTAEQGKPYEITGLRGVNWIELHFRSCISEVAFQKLHFRSCISEAAFQKLHFRSCISEVAFQKLHFRSCISEVAFQKLHVRSCISEAVFQKLQFRSCNSEVVFTEVVHPSFIYGSCTER